jgi:sugar phosphate isomerase/epimerase
VRVGQDNYFQLTYCTNIHPANGWAEVFANLQQYAPALKARFAPDRPFGLGLRLSGRESQELLEANQLQEFKDYLDRRGLYVFTLNGFPYGPFHKQPVKADVHAPDWRTEERVEYTLRLTEVLATLLPEGSDGGISTNPLSYKSWIDQADRATWELLTSNVVRVAATMARVYRDEGKLLHLDLEPEPDGLLDNSAELVSFFSDWLLPIGGPMLGEILEVRPDEGRRALLDHVRVCLDTCHMAVGYENPAEVLDRFENAGIQVGKLQVGSALDVRFPAPGGARQEIARALQPFADPVYLHQVAARTSDGGMRHYPDLDVALETVADPDVAEWRVHFHTPLFVERYGAFRSTQPWIKAMFELLRQRRFCRLVEIETYTWDVLPADLKRDLLDSIAREYEWVLDVFA